MLLLVAAALPACGCCCCLTDLTLTDKCIVVLVVSLSGWSRTPTACATSASPFAVTYKNGPSQTAAGGPVSPCFYTSSRGTRTTNGDHPTDITYPLINNQARR